MVIPHANRLRSRMAKRLGRRFVGSLPPDLCRNVLFDECMDHHTNGHAPWRTFERTDLFICFRLNDCSAAVGLKHRFDRNVFRNVRMHGARYEYTSEGMIA